LIFLKPIYGTIMYNRSRICASPQRNTEFHLVFATNWRFTIKP
jgi:hypothetical protein